MHLQKFIPQYPKAVEIKTVGRVIWRLARINLDAKHDYDLLSNRLLQEELGNPTVCPFSKEGPIYMSSAGGQDIDIEGYVELVWRFQQSQTRYKTVFLVTSVNDTTFDVELGRNSIIEYKLVDHIPGKDSKREKKWHPRNLMRNRRGRAKES